MQWDLQCAGTVLHVPGLKDSKYTRGVVAFVTGSERYPGAALLGVSAATQTGAGYVRYVGPRRCEDAILAVHPEVVFGEGTANAWVVGSGMDSAIAESGRRTLILSLLPGSLVTKDRGRDGAMPFIVMDAGALGAFYTAAKSAPDSPVIPRTVITPHSGEAAALARALGYDVHHGEVESSPRIWAQILADRLGCVCVLKGSDTVIATANRPGDLLEYTQGTHWLATAGTGDVLAGVIGTIVAQNAARIDAGELTLAQAAATGVALHGLAGALAAHDAMAVCAMGLLPFMVTTNGGPINASDVVSCLPLAYETIANPNEGTYARIRAIIDPTGEIERRYRTLFAPAEPEPAAGQFGQPGQGGAPAGWPAAPQDGGAANPPSDGRAVPDFGTPARPTVVAWAGSGRIVIPGSQARPASALEETAAPSASAAASGSGRIAVPGSQAPKAAKGGSGRIAVPGSQAPKGGSGRIAVPGSQAPKGGSGRIAVPGSQAPKGGSGRIAVPGAQAAKAAKGGSGRIAVPGAQAPKAAPAPVAPAKPAAPAVRKGGSGRVSVPGSQVVDVFSSTIRTLPGKGGSGRVSIPGSQIRTFTHERYAIPAPGAGAPYAVSQDGAPFGAAERFVPGSFAPDAAQFGTSDAAGAVAQPQAQQPAPEPAPAPVPPKPLPNVVTEEQQDDGTVDIVVPIRSAADPAAAPVSVSRSRSRVYDPNGDALRPLTPPAMKKPGADPKAADAAAGEAEGK